MHIDLHFTKGRAGSSLKIDGVDLTNHVLANGLRVEMNEDTDQPVLALRIKPDSIDVTGELDIQAEEFVCNVCGRPRDEVDTTGGDRG